LVPYLPHIFDYADMGLIPAGAYTNRADRSAFVKGLEQLSETKQFVLFDPQTSGGLLASVAKHLAPELVAALREAGVDAAVIGYTDAALQGLNVC